MVSKPKYGWSKVTIGNFQASASYLIDLPVKWLQSCIFGLTEKEPIVLRIDEEGAEDLVIVSDTETQIISDKDEQLRCFVFPALTIRDIAKELVQDIEENFEDWVQWGCDFNPGIQISERRQELAELMQKVKNLI